MADSAAVTGAVRLGAVWALFFATSVYGHVALKLAVEDRQRGPAALGALRGALGPWGLSAFAAWTASALLWMLVLEKQRLLDASSISSARYAFTCLAAWLFLRERVAPSQLVGVALIVAGIVLATRRP